MKGFEGLYTQQLFPISPAQTLSKWCHQYKMEPPHIQDILASFFHNVHLC